MATVKVWSERNDPNAPGGSWRDCTYSAGLMGLVFAGFTKFPAGAYTVAEREALERSDDQPDETGASLNDLQTAIGRRYKLDIPISRIALLAQHHARSDLGFVIQGKNGNLPLGSDLRRWDPKFTGGHAVFVVPTGDGTTVTWYDPEAPMGHSGDLVTWPSVTRWIGSSGSYMVFRRDFYAPALVYTEQDLKDRITEAVLEDRRKAHVSWD